MSNVLTFIMGYYVKSKYYIDDCPDHGSQLKNLCYSIKWVEELSCLEEISYLEEIN